MKRVLVTGASGFIGRRVLPRLHERGFEIHPVGRRPAVAGAAHWHTADLLDEAQRRALVKKVSATHLLHLAWYTEHGRFWEAPENVLWAAATIQLGLEFSRAGGRRAVFAGTCAEYDWTVGGRYTEVTTPIGPTTLYGACKDASRRVVEHLETEAAWGRVFFLYGPEEHPARLVANVARLLIDGDRAATSAGTQCRDFLHVDDVADAFAALLDSDVSGPVNIGSGEAVTVRHVVELIARAAGRPDLLDVGALQQRAGEPQQLVPDVTRLREEVGWRPAFNLERGLSDTVKWWQRKLESAGEYDAGAGRRR